MRTRSVPIFCFSSVSETLNNLGAKPLDVHSFPVFWHCDQTLERVAEIVFGPLMLWDIEDQMNVSPTCRLIHALIWAKC